MTVRRALIVAIGLAAAPAAAQSPGINQAIANGQVGERYDGYMALVGPASAQVDREVKAVNLRRRSLYTQLSTKRNVSPELVGMATGCQLLSQLAVGEAYMLSDHIWRRHAAGETVPLPVYCR